MPVCHFLVNDTGGRGGGGGRGVENKKTKCGLGGGGSKNKITHYISNYLLYFILCVLAGFLSLTENI